MENLQTLDVCDLPCYEYPENFQALGWIATLEEIRVERTATSLLYALSLEKKLDQTPAEGERRGKNLLFPALRHLDLLFCNLEETIEPFLGPIVIINSWQACLQTRRDHQQGIDKFSIVSCRVSKDLVAKLSELTNVEWEWVD